MGLLSDSAPPPRNPKLQYCLDQYTNDYIDNNAAMETQLIDRIAALDTSSYPKTVASDLAAGLSGYTDALASLREANAAELVIEDAAGAYRPQQFAVRQLEKQINTLKDENDLLRVDISRVSQSEEGQARKAILEARRAVNDEKIAALKAQIPDTWKGTYAEFSKLLTAESKARNLYRRSADRAYESFAKVADVAASGDAFKALEADLRAIEPQLDSADPKALADGIKDLGSRFGGVAGGSEVKKHLDALRKALTAGTVDTAKVRTAFDSAVQTYDAQLAFLNGPAKDLDQALSAAMPMLKETIGARTQDRLSRDQALSIAACSSHHRDVSLNF
jgi:hypothetical protein